MLIRTALAQKNLYKIGWTFLLVLSALMASSYLVLIFVDNAPALFTAYTAFSLYAFLVLLFPFREGKKWAWMATWILPVVLGLTAYFVPDFAPNYYGAAAVSVVGLFLTMQEFFSNGRGR